MKSNFKLFLPLVLLGALAWVGCQTQYPTSYYNVSSSAGVVLNFDSPWSGPQTVPTSQPASGPVTDTTGASVTTLTVNSTLAEANKPGNHVQTPGIMIPNGSPLVAPLIVGPGANNTAYCVHMAGTVVDTGNASYPAVMLSIPLETGGNGYFNASLFTGVKFYLKVPGTDNAVTRSFAIPIAQTSVPPQGTCNPGASSNACYNNFAYSYTSTGGNWQSVTLPFSTLTRGNYGAPISPTTLSGANLQQILSLQWSEGENNTGSGSAPVTGTVNFYVDEIQFY